LHKGSLIETWWGKEKKLLTGREPLLFLAGLQDLGQKESSTFEATAILTVKAAQQQLLCSGSHFRGHHRSEKSILKTLQAWGEKVVVKIHFSLSNPLAEEISGFMYFRCSEKMFALTSLQGAASSRMREIIPPCSQSC